MRFIPRYEFTWDLDKALANERKHGIAFQLASTVFNDSLAEIFHNVGHDAVEERWSILGMTPTGVLLLVVHAYVEGRGDRCVRIISARKATHYERREYETGVYSIREPIMKTEYDEHYEKAEGEFELDFSKGIRGAFANCRFPIFIDNAVLGHFHTRARTTGVDMTEAINDVLRRHVGLPSELPEPAERG
jgi:uncharacterized DUF497 family protein